MYYPHCHKNGCWFRVWAPERSAMALELPGRSTMLSMTKDDRGYFAVDVSGIAAGERYYYIVEGKRFPDPGSAYQPEGIYGPSELVDHGTFSWTDDKWKGLAFDSLIFYELHVGTFTQQGTFDAIIPRLADLASLGVNALELMPVAAFSGKRNWGYDGAFLYAVQHEYGGPEGLKRLVDACHAQGIAVFLDVVYNHIGREGNCLEAFGPYFSDKYHTPWGKAINYDGAWSDGVREFIVGNVLYWAEHYHLDGFRLDAIHEIFDRNAVTIWDELYAAVKEWEQRSGRRCWLVAESDNNSPRVVQPPAAGGLGLDAQWVDDFHHALYVLIDPQGGRYYRDFGTLEQFAKAWTQGFVHTGEYVKFRHRKHGASAAGVTGDHFIVFNQNHDLPGNRPAGERLSVLVGLPALKVAAAAVFLSPYIPLLFMGEEYGEDAPFFFFSDYQEAETTRGLLEGRKQQFELFQFEGEVRDPQDERLFLESKLSWEKRAGGDHKMLLEWHRELIRLRREHPLLRDLTKSRFRVDVLGSYGLAVYRYSASNDQHLVCLFNFSAELELYAEIGYAASLGGEWKNILASAEAPITVAAGGTVHLPSMSVAVYALNPLPVSAEPGVK